MDSKLKICGLILCLSLAASCSEEAGLPATDNSGTGGGGTGGGGDDGGDPGMQPTTQPTLSPLNFEGEAKFIGPRVHAIVGEVYRNLEVIHAEQDINVKMGLAAGDPGTNTPADDLLFVVLDDNPVPHLYQGNLETSSVMLLSPAPFADEDCGDGAGLNTVFFDFDDSGFGITANDQIIRDYDNVTCNYRVLDGSATAFQDDDTHRRLPGSVTGTIAFNFDDYPDPTNTNRFAGTATFGDPSAGGLDYELTDGLLQATTESISDTFNGSVDFDIDFDTGDATFTNISVTITSSSDGLIGPSLITIDTITRDLDPAGDSVTIENGRITSQFDGQFVDFRTIPYNLNGSASLDAPARGSAFELPNRGALLFEGGNGTAARARTDVGGGMRVVDLETSFDPSQPLDNIADPTTINQFDDGAEAEPGGSAFFVTGFLLTPQYFYPN